MIKTSSTYFSILVHETYCVNPGCSCTDAVLRFIELSEYGKLLNDWFEIRLVMCTWKITECLDQHVVFQDKILYQMICPTL